MDSPHTSVRDRLSTALADRYRIERELGAGGMATVYLAQDLKHDRKVAVKVLRPELAAVIGAERFLAEIKTTANLQHPHILPLHDSGEADGFLFYVMPYVEGESLRDRISREHQLPVPEAVRISREVASALDYAHRHRVIHRDIKPENILLHDGSALVADFGIALAVSSAGSRMTETGMSLGTPHYMSPEQAMGEREITARSDVYALGCVTYEMLVGEPPFTGPTVQSIIARVMTEEPRALTIQRKSIPPHVESAVRTALEKLPADRFATAAEFGAALGGEHTGVPSQATRMSRTGASRNASDNRASALRWAWIPAALVGLVAGLLLRTSRGTTEAPLRASLLAPPGDCDFADIGTSNLIQLSPDGANLAFVALCSGSRSLWIRNLADGTARSIAGTTNAMYPFWSPDGQSMGFFAEGRLKRIDLASSTVRDLAPATNGRGGAWNRDGVILYAPDVFEPLYRVPAAGGTPARVTVLPKGLDITQRLPYFLPDGHHFLFVEGKGQAWAGALLVGDLNTPATTPLLDVPSNVSFSRGRLFYVRDGALFAQPFSPDKAAFTGSAVAVVPRLETWPFKYLGNFSVTDQLIVYRAPSGQERLMDWFDPVTRAVIPAAEPGPYGSAHLSPDGTQVLLARSTAESPLADAWIYTPATQAWTRLTTRPDISYTMAWAPDGARIALKGASDSVTHVLSADHSEVATYKVPGPGVGPIEDWSPDGTFAVGSRQVRATGLDVTLIRFGTSVTESKALYATPADEDGPRISPSGRLVAYLANQSGRMEVYIASLADATAHWQVSQDGAYTEQAGQSELLDWSRDGHTLYYIDATQHLMAASITEGTPMGIGRPARVPGAPDGVINVTSAPGGRLLILHDDKRNRVPLTVMTRWPATLGAK